MIDRDIHLANALLIEGNALLRSTAAGQLRDLGIGNVTTASRVKDARLLLERDRFDIVVCSRDFEGSDESGQDLLDELRREHLLPHGTVFLMVLSEASYTAVMEAAESALDGFLVRPYTAAALGTRLTEARAKKRELAEVHRALDAGEPQVALVRAIKRFQEQQPYWMYCGRLAAELLLSMNKPDEARRIFERLVETKPKATWARLGIARTLLVQGELAKARAATAAVVQAEPQTADAHDLLGRILVDQCDFDGALAEYRAAAQLTPGCLLRAQHAGALAFYQGQRDDALQWLERSLRLGVQSKLFDALTLLLIAMLRFDRGDAVGVAAMREQLERFCARHPQSKRLKRLEQSAAMLVQLSGGRHDAALAALRELSAQAGDDDFDLESANMLLALWARVPEALRPAAEHGALAERIGERFCIGKAIAEVLQGAAGRAEPAAGALRASQERMNAVMREAMTASMAGDAAGAVARLLENGERTLNAKLLEMAMVVARRHAASLPDAEALAARANATLARSCQAASHIAGIQRSGRSPGGLQLRAAPHAA